MGKNKKKAGQKQPSSTGGKKTQKIFQVATTSSNKKAQKKTKEIPKKLKQLDLKTKDKANSQLKDLHLKMVTRVEKKEEKKSVGRKKGPAANTDQVQASLDKMDVK